MDDYILIDGDVDEILNYYYGEGKEPKFEGD